MATELTARDIIRIALELEQTGMMTYRDMKDRTPDKELAALLEYLAREEESHVALFTRMFKDVEIDPASMPDLSPVDSEYLDVVMKSVVFEGPKAGLKRAQEVQTPIAMLKLAMQFERDAMLFWMKIRSLVPAKDRPLVDALIRQEEEHVREIDRLIIQRSYMPSGAEKL